MVLWQEVFRKCMDILSGFFRIKGLKTTQKRVLKNLKKGLYLYVPASMYDRSVLVERVLGFHIKHLVGVVSMKSALTHYL